MKRFSVTDPWDLPDLVVLQSPRNRKTKKRTTKSGHWKITGKEREIKARETKICVGKKRIVVFLMGKSPAGCGTNWVIHEYHPLVENPQVLGHAEVNADLLSQPLLSSDWLFPEEDKLYLSELFDDEYPKINCVMDENQPEPHNSLPHQVYCYFLTLCFY
ncbi:hypothetical protein TIFTF001_049792 [Ficus carica]|uniref:NAC domain-containing protein n=2 Tax=Ficus carica TaxID=3494 RepID=A0AA87ZH54_FICCA|nr:hypothetical protein TIFTF001_049792 [Ficus carica]